MRKLAYIFIIISIAFSSCDDSFLDVPSTELSDDLIWEDPVLAEAFIVDLYNGIRLTEKEQSRSEGAVGFQRGLHWALWASVSDEAIYSNDDETYLVQRGQLSPSLFGFTSTTWGRGYRSIRESNLALEKIPELDITEERKAFLNAEVRFIRAWRYFTLLKGFGGIPIIGDLVTELGGDYSELYDRKSISETIDYIITELNYAIENLPDRNNSDWERGRANKAVAMALKSRVTLASRFKTDFVSNSTSAKSTKLFSESTVAESGNSFVSGPNPHAFTIGITVGSNAPSVSSKTKALLSKTGRK